MEKEQILQLIDRYLSGQASEEEKEILSRYYDSFDFDRESLLQEHEFPQELESRMLDRLKLSLNAENSKPAAKIRRLYRPWNIAACLAFFLLIGGVYIFRYKKESAGDKTYSSQTKKAETKTGRNEAILKLSDGSTIVLNEASNGVLKTEGNTSVRKTSDGKLIYEMKEGSQPVSNALNTISTPISSQYQLTLSDGTKVWLNAESSLTFPTQFDGDVREVQLKGEAYFEVAKVYKRGRKSTNRMPFYVHAGDTKVEVLGTHFNVMAYQESSRMETTLLEGLVRVVNGNREKLLAPGQQALLIKGENVGISVREINTEAVMAWKDGLFWFDDTDISEAMQQIRRWYDVDIIYEGPRPDVEFNGVLPRSSSVSTVLKMLESAKGVKFKVDGNRIIVRSN